MNIKKLGLYSRPYMIWLLVLVILPLLMMLFLTFFQTEALTFNNWELTLVNWRMLFTDFAVRVALKNSFIYASLATLIAFLIGYPMAYILTRSNFSNKLVILVLTIIPMWSNSLLRSYALANLLGPDSILNDLLSNYGMSFVWDIKGTGLSITIALVLTYLPFMILPIYTVLEKIEPSLLEASMDLGANPSKTFMKVTFPMSLKGVATGVIMVFLPSFSGFAIPKILGNGQVVFIGTLIDSSFINRSYNFGSVLSLVIILIIFGSMFVVQKVDKEGETLL
ncbi:MAG: ABC transporter permease [Candidatus Izemoplasmatales bacterium]